MIVMVFQPTSDIVKHAQVSLATTDRVLILSQQQYYSVKFTF